MNNDIMHFIHCYNVYNELHVTNMFKELTEEKVQDYDGMDKSKVSEEELKKSYYYKDEKRTRELMEESYRRKPLHSYDVLGSYKRIAMNSIMNKSVPDLFRKKED